MHGNAQMPPTASVHPPRPPFVMTLGVTGHRLSRIPVHLHAHVYARIIAVIESLKTAALAVASEGSPWFAPDPPSLRILSALADGADRWVADAAIAAGFTLDAVLPFDIETYADDFPEGAEREAMRALFALSERRLVLPGKRAEEVEAYAMAGEALVAHSTILIAIWDGEPGKGWGGTADVVETAVDSGVPVIQVPPDPAQPIRFLWPSFEPFAAPPHYAVQAPSRPFEPAHLEALLRQLLLPPQEPSELRFLEGFYREKERLRRLRVEYPLLLHLAGVKPIRRSTVAIAPFAQATAETWAPFRAEAGTLAPVCDSRIGRVELAYAWCDNLANEFAQTFRSGHVLNFVLAGLASVVALLGLVLPGWKLWLVIVELMMIGGIVWNTRAGHAGHWQQRWLDYRALAERLQPIRTLKLLGAAAPPRSPSRKRRLGSRWTDWYLAAHWRAFGCPSVVLDQATFAAVRQLIVRYQLEPEIAYHHSNAARMEKLELRLHKLGQILFTLTISTCTAIILLYLFEHDWLVAHMGLFVVLSAGLPAMGGAVYALRVHGDYDGSAARSEETATEIERIRHALVADDISLLRASALAEAAARIMLVDLDEFRLTYEQRGLAIPG
jgi:hypothetical protein